MTKAMIALLAMVAAPSALAQQGTAPQAAATDAAKPEKKICRKEIVTGSMMAKRTCHTAAEWAQIDQTNAANTEELSRRSNVPRN